MSELKQQMEKILYKNYKPVKGLGADEIDQAIRDILALPSLQATIEKAEKYDNLFSSLQTVKTHKALVSGTLSSACAEQDIYRPLTETEKEEVMKWMFNFIFVRRSNQSFPLIAFTLNSGIRVVVKK